MLFVRKMRNLKSVGVEFDVTRLNIRNFVKVIDKEYSNVPYL